MISMIIKGVISGIASYFLVPFMINIGETTTVTGMEVRCLIVWYVLAFLWSYLMLSSGGFGLERGGIGVILYPILGFCVGGAFTMVTMAFFYGLSIGETFGNGIPWDSLIGVPITIAMLLFFPIRDLKRIIEER